MLYASRADYEVYHPLLTGMGTDNGGVYIERGATFYTYQRRVPQDSSLTLEELFRHEYVHYLNGRFAVPGFFGEGPWYEGDRTTAMDEGSAEFFDGSTRDDGIAVRQSLVREHHRGHRGRRPPHDRRPAPARDLRRRRLPLLRLRRDVLRVPVARTPGAAPGDVPASARRRPGRVRLLAQPHGVRRRLCSSSYDAFLDAQIAIVDDLFVPDTTFTSPTAP